MASQKIKGLTIKLNADTTAINDALSNTNKSLSSTQKELTQVNKLLKFDPKNTTLMAQKQSLLTDAINDTKKKLQELEKVQKLANEDSGVDKASKEYRDLERQIEQAKQKISNFEKEQRGLNGALEDGGKNASNFGDIVKGNLVSSAIIGGVKALASAIKDVAKSMYESVREAGTFADDVNTMSKQFNMSTKEIQQYIRASDLIDVSVETIAKSMNKLTMSLKTTNKQTLATFDTLGVKIKDTNGELRDSNTVFYELLEALSLIENETQQDAYALDIFGRSASELGPLINGGAEQLKLLNEYLEKNGLILSQQELDNLNAMNDSFDTLSASFDAIKTKIAVELAPIITPLVEQLSNFMVEHKDEIIEMVKGVVEWLTGDKAKEMFESIKGVFTDIGEFLDNKENIKKAIEDITKTMETLYKVLKAMADVIETILKPFFTSKEEKMEWWNNRGANDPDWWKWLTGKGGSGGFGDSNYQSGGFGNYRSAGFTSNLTINVSSNQTITESVVRSWANIINDELGQMV